MGCGGTKAADDKEPKKLEDDGQDYVADHEAPKLEEYDFEGLNKKLPTEKDEEGKKARLKLWNEILNYHGNGSCSYKKVEKDFRKYLDLPDEIYSKGPLRMAFDEAKAISKASGWKSDDDYLQYSELRSFLIYLKQYFEYWAIFHNIDSSNDDNIGLEEFKRAIDNLKAWGVNFEDPEAGFKQIDVNGSGTITFDEFVKYAINTSLSADPDLKVQENLE